MHVKSKFWIVAILLCLMILPNTLFAGTMDQPVRELIANADDNDFLPVVVLMAERQEIAKIRDMVQGIPRSQRAPIVWEELSVFAENSQASLMEVLFWEMDRGRVQDVRSLIASNGISMKAQPAVIEMIAARSDVYTILDDSEDFDLLPATVNPGTDELDEIAWGVDRVNAPEVWEDGFTGEGVLIAVVDTGVNYNHLDLQDHLWDGGDDFPYHGWDFHNNDNNPIDDNAHGTHCAGTVCGDGTAGDQTGVAPDATLMCLKVLSGGGSGSPSNVWAALDFTIEHEVDVISMSLGWIINSTTAAERGTWRENFDATDAAGIVSAVAAGNERGWYPVPNNCRCPGNAPSPWRHPDETGEGSQGGVISVGATDASNGYASFSSQGPCTWQSVPGYEDWVYQPGLIRPDIAAPGVGINSCRHDNNSGYRDDYDGTSMATPHVAGVICLMFSKNMDLLTSEVDSILQVTAWDLGTAGKDTDYGAGIAQANDAVDAVYYATGYIEGVVTDANTEEVMEGVIVTASRGRVDTTDVNGYYNFEIPIGPNSVFVNLPPYTPFQVDSVIVDSAETTVQDIALTVGLFATDPEELQITMVDTTETHTLSISNSGSAPMDVELKIFPVIGEETDDFMDELFALSVSDSTGDNRLNGFVYGNGEFFIAGSNNTSNPNYIYRFGIDGEYLGSFVQPHSDDPGASSAGYRDLAFDGTYLYGSFTSDISVIDPETGEEVRVIDGPYNPNRAITYDPNLEALWVAEYGRDIIALDIETGEEITRIESELRAHAMTWYSADPDDMPLYILVQQSTNGTQRELYKADPETGEIVFVQDLPLEDERAVNGISVINVWETYYTVLTGMHDQSGGADRIVGWELDLYVGWAVLDHDQFTVEPGESEDVDIYFDASELENQATYEAYIRAQHNTAEEESQIDITVTVDIDAIDGDGASELPLEYSLEAPYPNPFNATTHLRFSLPEQGHITLAVYDVLGRMVTELYNGEMDAGRYNVSFDAQQLASGPYFVRMSTESGFTRTAKLILLK